MFKSILLSFCVVTAFAGANGIYTRARSSKTCSVPVVCREEGAVTTEWKAYAAGKQCQPGGSGGEAVVTDLGPVEERLDQLDASIAEITVENANAREANEQLRENLDAMDEKYVENLSQQKETSDRRKNYLFFLGKGGKCDFFFNGKCFFGQFPRGSARDMSFAEAEQLCIKNYAHPANVYNKRQYEMLADYMRNAFPAETELASWLGMRADPLNGVYTYSNRDVANYLPWYRTDGDNYPRMNGANSVVGVHITENPSVNPQGIFNWSPEGQNSGVICEVDTGFEDYSDLCDFTYDQKCFFGEFPNGQERITTESQAEQLCTDNSATPANVYSQAHYDMMADYMRKAVPGLNEIAVWIGMKAYPLEGRYTLSNGDPAPFLHWFSTPGDAYPRIEAGWNWMAVHISSDPSVNPEGMFNRKPDYAHNHGVICEIDMRKMR